MEYRQPIGFDSVLNNYPASTNGILIHTGSESSGDSSFLLDINPQTTTFNDAALAWGQTFTDSAAGVTITAVSGNSSGASVNVTLGTSSCVHANPAMSISPLSASVAVGSTVNYTVSVTNKDSTNCNTGNFNLTAVVPSGWSANFASPLLTLAPGASGSTTVQVTSPSGAASGLYNVTVSATNAAATNFKVSVTATYAISTPGAADFSLSAVPASVSIVRGSSASIAVTSSITGGFSSAVSLTAIGLPTGVTATFNPLTLPAPGSGSSTVRFNVASTAATGPFTVNIQGVGGGKTHSIAIALLVQAASGTQLLGNPGFEKGAANPSPWWTTAYVIDNSTAQPAHSGVWKAWLAGYGVTHTDWAYQQVAISATATSAVLSFWLHIDTNEATTSVAYDRFQVQVRDTSNNWLATLVTYSNLNAAPGYAKRSFSLAPWKGRTIRIFFIGAENASRQTSFVVDDTALDVQ